MHKISIIIPAHNEEKRIKKTIKTYYDFFHSNAVACKVHAHFIIVLNGCVDNTLRVIEECSKTRPHISIINIIESGKGLAVKTGFASALAQDSEIIGFVDADMATSPHYYYDLITHLKNHDSIIASRYMPGSYVSPKRPFVKQWGIKLVYNSLIRVLFNLNFHDYQCGAKLFKRHVITAILPHLTTHKWAFDVELLYLCALYNFSIHEVPTTWLDQAGSKLNVMGSGIRMLYSLFEMKKKHRHITRIIMPK